MLTDCVLFLIHQLDNKACFQRLPAPGLHRVSSAVQDEMRLESFSVNKRRVLISQIQKLYTSVSE